MALPRDPSTDPRLSKERLDRYLAALYPDLSRSAIQHLIAEGRVRVNGQIAKASHRLKPTDTLHMDPTPDPFPSPSPDPIPLCIIYEDEYLMAVDKPAGLTTHPAPGHQTGTLANALLSYLPDLVGVGDPSRPGIVHRLDKDTSGLMLDRQDRTRPPKSLRPIQETHHNQDIPRTRARVGIPARGRHPGSRRQALHPTQRNGCRPGRQGRRDPLQDRRFL